jgi:hypothetical protein
MSFACRFNGGSSEASGSGLAISISPTALTNSASGASSGSIGPLVATATGGTGGYTYAWLMVYNAYGGSDPTVASPTSASTNVSITGVLGQDTKEATFQCTVTDSSGTTAVVYATASHFNTDAAP